MRRAFSRNRAGSPNRMNSEESLRGVGCIILAQLPQSLRRSGLFHRPQLVEAKSAVKPTRLRRFDRRDLKGDSQVAATVEFVRPVKKAAR